MDSPVSAASSLRILCAAGLILTVLLLRVLTEAPLRHVSLLHQNVCILVDAAEAEAHLRRAPTEERAPPASGPGAPRHIVMWKAPWRTFHFPPSWTRR